MTLIRQLEYYIVLFGVSIVHSKHIALMSVFCPSTMSDIMSSGRPDTELSNSSTFKASLRLFLVVLIFLSWWS